MTACSRYTLKPSAPLANDNFAKWKGRVAVELKELTAIHQADATRRFVQRWRLWGLQPVLVFDAIKRDSAGSKVCNNVHI